MLRTSNSDEKVFCRRERSGKGIEDVLLAWKIGNLKFPVVHGKRRLQIQARRSSVVVKDREKGIEDVLLAWKIGNLKFPVVHGKSERISQIFLILSVAY